MAPQTHRQGAGAPAAATGPAPTFAEVPTGVLQHILGFLDVSDSQRDSLMCRRWYDCVHSGELCRHVVMARSASYWRTFDSLACWLRRHGQHVRSLHLERGRTGLADDPDEYLLMGCCLSLTAAVGQLERLHIVTRGGLVVSAGWMQPLHCLQQLSLVVTPGALIIDTDLRQKAQLTALRLAASPVLVETLGRLPPMLLRLELTEHMHEEPPVELSCLTRLSALRLKDSYWHLDRFAVLKQLPALRKLMLHSPLYPVFDCLGELTQIEDLVLADHRTGTHAALELDMNTSLQPLTQLTSLCISTHGWEAGLPALAGLSRLQRLCMQGGGPPNLPAGQWMGSLRELGTSWACLCSSTQALAAAAQLQHVAVLEGLAAEPLHDANPNFFAWAAAHAPLQCLHFYLQGAMPKGQRTAIGQLQKQRPELDIRQTSLAAGSGLEACPFAASFDPQPFV